MKYFLLPVFSILFSISIFAQDADTLNFPDQEEQIVSENDSLSTDADTTLIRLGDKKVKIIEEDGETSVIIKEKEDEDDDDWDFDWEWDNDKNPFADKDDDYDGKFKGHWAGFEFGINNYVDKDFSMKRTPESEFLDLNTSRSWNFNLNFAQYSIPIVSDRFGLVTGMGLEWSNYHFSDTTTVAKNTTTKEIEALPITGSIKKNRLQTTYLTVPLLLELQLLKGSRSDRLYLAGGVIGGLKLGSNTKYKTDNNTKKEKGDYYLQPFRYGLTARVGYKLVKLYANYYMTPLFVEDRGPELYPFAMGLTLAF